MESAADGRPSSSSSSLRMDEETALELVKKGATLLLLDVPQHTLLGIDTQIFLVGPMFKGVKMIPPGPHFIYYGSTNRDGTELSPITGFFIYTSPSEVVAFKWQQQKESLVKLYEDEEQRYSEAVKHLEFDRYLGPYPLNNFGEWKQISNFITKTTIERIEPIGGEISIMYETDLTDIIPRTAADKLAEQLTSNKFSRHSDETKRRACFYTSVPHLVRHSGVPMGELTAMNLDKTQLLETILMKDFGGAEDLLLGELQFAFIAFLMAQSLQAFRQWKSLVSLLLNCIEAPFKTRTQLFTKFARVIYYQLRRSTHCSNGSRHGEHMGISSFIDDSWFSKDTFLNPLCKDFFALVEQAPAVDGDLLLWTRKLKNLLETTFGWDFPDNTLDNYEEGDEFSPVVVLPTEINSGEG